MMIYPPFQVSVSAIIYRFSLGMVYALCSRLQGLGTNLMRSESVIGYFLVLTHCQSFCEAPSRGAKVAVAVRDRYNPTVV